MRRRQTVRGWELCRSLQKYFAYWEGLAAAQPLAGLGDRLAVILWRLGLARLAHRWYAWRRRSCRCEARRRWLNRLWPW